MSASPASSDSPVFPLHHHTGKIMQADDLARELVNKYGLASFNPDPIPLKIMTPENSQKILDTTRRFIERPGMILGVVRSCEGFGLAGKALHEAVAEVILERIWYACSTKRSVIVKALGAGKKRSIVRSALKCIIQSEVSGFFENEENKDREKNKEKDADTSPATDESAEEEQDGEFSLFSHDFRKGGRATS